MSATIDFQLSMERAGRVLGTLDLSGRGVTEEQLALSAWPVAVGKKIAARTSAVSLIRTRLVVEVEDEVWQRQLFALRDQILAQIEKATGRRIVEELHFRVAVPRRQPARAESSHTPGDEADAIRDPFMRKLYIAARRKATA